MTTHNERKRPMPTVSRKPTEVKRPEPEPELPRKLRLAGAPKAEPEYYRSWQGSLSSHFTMVPNGLLRGDLGLTNDEHSVLLVLLSWAPSPGSAGPARPSATITRKGGVRIPNLAEWANQSRSQTKRSLKVLTERGFITAELRPGESSTYTVHHDHIARHIKMPPPTLKVKEKTPTQKRLAVELDEMVDRIMTTAPTDDDEMLTKAYNLPTMGRRRKGTTPNKWAQDCMECGVEVPAGAGVMWRGGPRHHRCMPRVPLTLNGKTPPVRNRGA